MEFAGILIKKKLTEVTLCTSPVDENVPFIPNLLEM